MENKEMMPDPYSMPELKIWNISEPTMMNNKKFEKLETREDVSIKNYAKNKIKKFWLSGKLYEEKTVITILAREWSEWVSNYRANFVYGLEKESIIAPIKVMMFNTEMIEVHVYEEQKTNNSKPSDLELTALPVYHSRLYYPFQFLRWVRDPPFHYPRFYLLRQR